MKRVALVAITCMVVVALTFALAPAAQADSIGVNYNCSEVDSLLTGITGVVPQDHWTTVHEYANWDCGGNLTDLQNNTGMATTTDVVWAANGTWAIQSSDPGSSNPRDQLLNGYLNAGSAGITQKQTTLAISRIPYAAYDLYVYFGADQPNRAGSITDGATTYYFQTIGALGHDFTPTTSTDLGSTYPLANYARFQNLTNSNVTVTCDIPVWGGIAGFQIISIPEPGTFVLWATGLFGLLAYAWRKRR